MRIECPHCKNALNVVADSDETESGTCPSCGSKLPQFASTAPYRGELLKRIGRFELLEEVGKGQFGTVWKARDTRIERIVALKLPRQEEVEETTKALFLREAQASAAVQHPNIVTVLDVDEILGQIFIASEFINGVTLRQKLQQGRMSFAGTAELLMSVADGVHKAHEAGITHRDLKPSNILVDVEGKPYVADFGLAKRNTAEITMTVTGMILGTPAYMSPEQARGDSHTADRRSDVYSLGVILYEMITGQKPFDGSSEILLHQIQSDDPRMPRTIERTIPRDLETICLKAMEKSADKRYQTAGEFADDLRCYLAGEPIQARRSSPLERIWRKVKRNPAFTAVTLIALISVGVATVLASVKSPPAPVPPGPGQPIIQTATFITSPEEATLHIYPRDRVTGEPQYADGVHPEGVTPLTMDLASGRYLVVAVLADGRFHEVYRNVPDAPSAVPERYPHERWEVKDDGTVELPSINIPSDDVSDGMAFVKGLRSFRVGVPGSPMLTEHARVVPDFFVDAHEVTMGDYKQATDGLLPVMFKNRSNLSPDDFPVTEIFVDEAIAYAERIGKRLITEFEYEFVATNGGKTRFPWGQDWRSEVRWTLSPVGSDSVDRTLSDPPVFGLFSNASEMTSSWFVPYPNPDNLESIAARMAGFTYVIRGGPIAPPRVDSAKQLTDAWTENGVPYRIPYSSLPAQRPSNQIGFRCARSVSPIVGP